MKTVSRYNPRVKNQQSVVGFHLCFIYSSMSKVNSKAIHRPPHDKKAYMEAL